MQNIPNLSVAILMNDIEKIKELSKIFRKVGVLAHFYEDLKSFWKGSLESVASLCIVDIRMMNSGGLNIKNHPLIKSESLPIAFYCPEDCGPLLFSTFDIFNVGVIREDKFLSGQIKSVLKRINKLYALEVDAKNKTIDNSKLEKHLHTMIEKNEELKEQSYYDNKLVSWGEMIERGRKEDDFIQALEKLMTEWKEIDSFSYLELSQSRKRLVSAHSFHHKFQTTPSLWAGKKLDEGIEFFAQNMASQVALDILGGEVMCLNIRCRHESPEALLYIRVTDMEMMKFFEWEILERELSALYSFFELHDTSVTTSARRELTPWNTMEILDQHFFGERNLKEDEKGLIDIDFSKLIEFSLFDDQTNSKMKFYWNKFHSEFMNRLSSLTHLDAQLTFMGPAHLGVLIPIEKADEALASLKSIAARFPIWRFFEDPEIVLTQNLRPVVRMLPISNEAYLQYMNSMNGKIEASHVEAKDLPKSAIRPHREVTL